MSTKGFPLTIIDSDSGQILYECVNFTDYPPQHKEHFTFDKQRRYRVSRREFFYDTQMKLVAVELWVTEL